MSRKRLGQVTPQAVEAARAGAGQRHARVTAPIAQMAAGVSRNIDAEIQRLREALESAEDQAAQLASAEAEGRVLLTLPLEQIDLGYITRDRIAINRSGEEWAALKTSIAARGQQMPIEVVDQGEEAEPRYGLISGMRRVLVLQELFHETGDARHARVTAMQRAPDLAAIDRLVAMIEENEIRAGISFYERGRIAALAAAQGVFADADQAVEVLFASSHRNRRYKIRCFVTVHEALDGALWFPQAIGERLGIELAKAIRAGHGAAIRAALDGAGGRDAEDEVAMLTRLVSVLEAPAKVSKPRPVQARWDSPDGRRITARLAPATGKITLDTGGAEIDAETLERLAEWLGREIS